MTRPARPLVECDQQHVSVFVNDLDAAVGCCLFFNVANVDDLLRFHRANGVEITQEIGDRPWHIRDYTVRDLNGLLHRLRPAPAERRTTDYDPARRLARPPGGAAGGAAPGSPARNRMTLSSCLEEILLHSNDGVTPHTKGTVACIQELKKKHGIDYVAHGSYRFIEE